jgi:hypothetical protein
MSDPSSGKVIWKFPLPLGGWGFMPKVKHTVQMPMVCHPLSLQMQKDVPTLWAQVDPQSSPCVRTFEWVGTGHEVPYEGKYVGTVQANDGDFVFHLYELPSSGDAA